MNPQDRTTNQASGLTMVVLAVALIVFGIIFGSLLVATPIANYATQILIEEVVPTWNGDNR